MPRKYTQVIFLSEHLQPRKDQPANIPLQLYPLTASYQLNSQRKFSYQNITFQLFEQQEITHQLFTNQNISYRTIPISLFHSGKFPSVTLPTSHFHTKLLSHRICVDRSFSNQGCVIIFSPPDEALGNAVIYRQVSNSVTHHPW